MRVEIRLVDGNRCVHVARQTSPGSGVFVLGQGCEARIVLAPEQVLNLESEVHLSPAQLDGLFGREARPLFERAIKRLAHWPNAPALRPLALLLDWSRQWPDAVFEVQTLPDRVPEPVTFRRLGIRQPLIAGKRR